MPASVFRTLVQPSVVDGWGVVPAGVREFGAVVISRHLFTQTRLRWRGKATTRPYLIVVLPQTGRVAVGEGPDAAADASGEGIAFLSTQQLVLTLLNCWTADVIWAPADAFSGMKPGEGLPVPLAATAPTVAVRSLAGALLGNELSTEASDLWLEQHLTQLCAEAVRFSLGTGVDERFDPLVDRARALMLSRRSDGQLTAGAVAQELHVSLRQLQRAFAAAGSAPADELQRMRVELALNLLRRGSASPVPMSEVAAASGFSSVAAMRRAFVRHEGERPRAVRSDLRNAGVAER